MQPFSWRLWWLVVMLAEPVMKDLSRRAIAQRGVAGPPVVEHCDVLELVGLHETHRRDVQRPVPCPAGESLLLASAEIRSIVTFT